MYIVISSSNSKFEHTLCSIIRSCLHLDENILHGCCVKLGDAQKHNDKFDIDADDLFLELQVLHMCLSPEIKPTIEVLKFVKTPNCFPNVSIAY